MRLVYNDWIVFWWGFGKNIDHLLNILTIFRFLQRRFLRSIKIYLKLFLVIYLQITYNFWKNRGVISGPYFPVFGRNTNIYGVLFAVYSVRYSVNSVRYLGPIIRNLINQKLSIIYKLIGKLKYGIHKCKPRKCPFWIIWILILSELKISNSLANSKAGIAKGKLNDSSRIRKTFIVSIGFCNITKQFATFFGVNFTLWKLRFNSLILVALLLTVYFWLM